MNRLIGHLVLLGLALTGFTNGSAVAQNLPPCFMEGPGGRVANVGLEVGDLCSLDGKVQKLVRPCKGDHGRILDFSRCLKSASKADLERVLSSSASTSTPFPSPPPADGTSESSTEDADVECVDCDRKCTTRIAHTRGTDTFCLAEDGPKMIVSGPNGPGFAPVLFPMMDPNLVLCGPSKPVTHKGVTVCGCKEVINSKIMTNPILQEGQYCISEGKFYLAKKCSDPFEWVKNIEKAREDLVKEIREKNRELDRCEERAARTSECKDIQNKIEELESKLSENDERFHQEFQKKTYRHTTCELEKASKKDIKLIKWVQKNQRMKYPKGMSMPGKSMPGMSMPGMSMPVSGNSDDSKAPDSGATQDKNTSKSGPSWRGQ